MRRATVTIPPELAEAFERFAAEQPSRPRLGASVRDAFRDYLERRGHWPKAPFEPPVGRSGFGDTSLTHDRILSELSADRKLQR